MSAITHHNGPCLVLAGPGSGKTKVITHRITHLINEQKISPEHILTITFTKAAAREMEARFLGLMPQTNTFFGTFHACFFYMLKKSYTNFPNTFISSSEKAHLLKHIFQKRLSLAPDMQIPEIEKLLGLYINTLFQIENEKVYADFNYVMLETLYQEYRSALKKRHMLDFDVLLLEMYELLKNNPEMRQKWQRQFAYIQIDECQDMNLLQYETIKLLANDNQNVFMVGDDDQSIYRFRGSDFSIMNRFINEFHDVKRIDLDTNFRSNRAIVVSSQKVIKQNTNRFDKKVIANHQNGTGVCVKNFTYRSQMLEYVLESLLDAPENDLGNHAIICRTNSEIKNWGYLLRKSDIPYLAREERNSIFDTDWYMDIESYFLLAKGKDSNISHKMSDKVNVLKEMRPFLALKYIWNVIGYGKWLEKQYYKQEMKYIDILEQYQFVLEETKNYKNLDEWISHVQTDRDYYNQQAKEQYTTDQRGVHLLTMHASKGLEFDTVILPDINKGKIPRGFTLNEAEIEEERRLLYVAMTRAKKNLEILYIKGTEDHKLQPSVFLEPLL